MSFLQLFDTESITSQ